MLLRTIEYEELSGPKIEAQFFNKGVIKIDKYLELTKFAQ